MQNQEEKAAKKGEQLFWRKCPICAQEFKDFLPLIKHIEEHCRRESQAVKIELGQRTIFRRRLHVSSFLLVGELRRTKGLVAGPRKENSQPMPKFCYSRLRIGCRKL